MGEEINGCVFSQADFDGFHKRLEAEQAILERWFHEGRFSERQPRGGFELEAWLVDHRCAPLARNGDFLHALGSDLVTWELSQFNVELNNIPCDLSGDGLRRLQGGMDGLWRHCQDCARQLGARLVMIGILPTVRQADLGLQSISPLARYRALNDQVLALRGGAPIEVDIEGRDHLRIAHGNLMLESATTSFQVHLQAPFSRARALYNASYLASAPVVGLAANSPYLFGRELWCETRIPLFEQAANVNVSTPGGGPWPQRVSFGSGYVSTNLIESFTKNCWQHPVLLPVHMDAAPETLRHLRLHNGTIWRWNRPLLGFDEDGTPHLRIEHRVIGAGPCIADSVANAAFYFGLATALSQGEPLVEGQLPFATAKQNFYAAAKYGLEAEVTWIGGKRMRLDALVLHWLLPMAALGLEQLGLDGSDIDTYLGILEGRARSGQTGAVWQRGFIARHGVDFGAMTHAYAERSDSGRPVHEWDL